MSKVNPEIRVLDARGQHRMLPFTLLQNQRLAAEHGWQIDDTNPEVLPFFAKLPHLPILGAARKGKDFDLEPKKDKVIPDAPVQAEQTETAQPETYDVPVMPEPTEPAQAERKKRQPRKPKQ